MKKHFIIIAILFCWCGFQAFSQMTIKGVVTEPDSITPMPFVYVINSQTGLGQMSDGNGHFTIQASDKDSIIKLCVLNYSVLKLVVCFKYKDLFTVS